MLRVGARCLSRRRAAALERNVASFATTTRRGRPPAVRSDAAAAAGPSGAAAAAGGPGAGGAPRDVASLVGVTIVSTHEEAKRALEVLCNLPPDRFHACDTEVADINLEKEGPVGHGVVTCASVYSGPDVDFGNGPKLWIDNLDGAEGVLDVFKPWFESTEAKKVYHNYGFDRHVLYNHGIDARGLGADTMHMARLWNSARAKLGGYSLESLTADLIGARKVPMKERFAVPRPKKDGSPGKETDVPPVRVLQREPRWRADWIDYSTFDAESTWRLREQLAAKLSAQVWVTGRSMLDFYTSFIAPYAELLTDMEREGIQVDTRVHLPAAEVAAKADKAAAEAHFIAWAASRCPDAASMNVQSDAQKAHFLFAPATRVRRRGAKAPAAAAAAAARAAPATAGDAAGGGAGEVEDENAWPRERVFDIENTTGYVEPGKKKALKHRGITLVGQGLPPPSRTVAGWPACSISALAELAGDVERTPPRYGPAHAHYGGGPDAVAACEAIHALMRASAVDTMLSNFILPLQAMADANGRVHCSLNLNTETGRLSARRPNLQNQPALEKDRYKIRRAFGCRPGNTLIVADYGQLELRVLAHMTKCKSMLEAFVAGGDFHSRTAMGMYPHIAKDVESGAVLLEWDSSKGKSTVPMLKDKYGAERRQAKILNFSIAYGKTPVGLSKDFGVPVSEAKETVEKWYQDRPEVRRWQQEVLSIARKDGCTRTLMGRYRELPEINSRNFMARGHSERAAINTPIQGGAADIVMMAMLKIARNGRLRELGWKMLLQVHDEVILEGPRESVEEALACVVRDMEHPFERPLLVALAVDAGSADTWYDAK